MTALTWMSSCVVDQFRQEPHWAHIGTNTVRVQSPSESYWQFIWLYVGGTESEQTTRSERTRETLEQPNPVLTRYCSYSNSTLLCNIWLRFESLEMWVGGKEDLKVEPARYLNKLIATFSQYTLAWSSFIVMYSDSDLPIFLIPIPLTVYWTFLLDICNNLGCSCFNQTGGHYCLAKLSRRCLPLIVWWNAIGVL